MSGVLGLATPWARQEFPDMAERRAIEARIRDGYTVGAGAERHRGDWHVWVVEVRETLSDNRVLVDWYHLRDLRAGVERAIAWIDSHDTVEYAGVEVPVR